MLAVIGGQTVLQLVKTKSASHTLPFRSDSLKGFPSWSTASNSGTSHAISASLSGFSLEAAGPPPGKQLATSNAFHMRTAAKRPIPPTHAIRFNCLRRSFIECLSLPLLQRILADPTFRPFWPVWKCFARLSLMISHNGKEPAERQKTVTFRSEK